MKRFFLFLLGSYAILYAGESLRFAWMSDIHTSGLVGQKDLGRAVRDINGQDSIDFVIVSGDLTDYDFPGHIERAKVILDSLNVPYYAIPGNHEYKWTYSGGREYIRVFGYDKFNVQVGNFRFVGYHQGPLLRMGDGFVDPADVRWLREAINSIEDHEKIFIINHYPIDNSVRNYRDVLSILQTKNVQAVFHGHHHRNEIKNYGGITGIAGRSTLARRDEGGYNIVLLTPDSMFVREKMTGGELKDPWFKMALFQEKRTDYEPIEAADYSVNDLFPDVNPHWETDLEFLIAGAPAVTYSRILVGLNNGDVVALSRRSGKELWRFTTGGPVLGNPVVEGNIVIVASCDSTIYGIHLRKGNEVWSVKGDMPFVSSAAVRDGKAYIGGSDGKIRCINASDGELIWTFEGVEQYIEATPAVTKEHVIVGAWDRHLYTLDRFTGELAWKWAGPMAGVLYSPAVCQPVVHNGVIFIVAPDRVMTALDEKTGDVKWRTDEHMVRESIGISECGLRVYARTMQDSVICMDATADSAVTLWKTSGNFGYDIGMAPPVEKKGVLFYPTQRGEVHAMDPLTGEILWKHRVSTALVNALFPRTNNDIVLTTMDGKVIRLLK